MALGKGGRVFVTGASGFIGSRVAKFAVDEGYEVYGLSRTEQSDEKIRSLGAVPVRGDLTTLDVLRREAAAADAVFHLADPHAREFTMPWEEVLRIDTPAVTAMADGLEGSGKPLVVTSGSVVAAPDPSGKETTETSLLWPEGQAPHLRHLAERADLALGAKNIKVCVIRLAQCVYGQGGSGPRFFLQMAHGRGKINYPEEGNKRMSTVHVDDAARMYILAAQKADGCDIFNCTAPSEVTSRKISEAVGKAIGVPAVSLKHDDMVAQFGPFLVKAMSTENHCSSAKATEKLGWKAQEVGIEDDIISGSYKAVAMELKTK
ncbi:putative NAD dependent epimerase/dehydratase [Thozetella sp. PMI_491]|nr:putative NAD dependent epimerase/dehydratase [Thozetella sp. PMI_491]